MSLHQEIQNYKAAQKAARKGYPKGDGKGAKNTKSKGQKGKRKRSYDEMSDNEKWWVDRFLDGSLKRMKNEAASKSQPIEASPFTIGE